MTTINQLQTADFQKTDDPLGYQHFIQIWGTTCNVAIYPVDDSSLDLSILLPRAKECLHYINNTQTACIQSILDANMVKLTEEWIERF